MALLTPEAQPQQPMMLNVDKLSHEIFSILEAQFLFGYQPNKPKSHAQAPPPPSGSGKVRILSIDASGPTEGLLAAASLVHLESSLRLASSLPDARLADFFDLAAGSGSGGILAALLFTRGPDGRPLLSASSALRFLSDHRRALSRPRRKFAFLRSSRGSSARVFEKAFGDLTLRDALKPLLVPCYDMATRAAFVFSRADAVEADGFDFLMRDICVATCADPTAVGPVEMASVDGQTHILAVDGGVAMSNPTSAAITHVLNNRQEFPHVCGVEDLLVVSLGNGEPASGAYNGAHGRSPSRRDIIRIAGDGVADMVDQAVSMAFGNDRTSNYVRIQANGYGSRKTPIKKETSTKELMEVVEGMLKERNVESVMFRGKKIAEKTNEEKLEIFAKELVKEEERRKLSIFPTVILKQITPRTSSSTTSSC